MNMKAGAVKALDFVATHPREIIFTTAGILAGIAVSAFYYESDIRYVRFSAKKADVKKLSEGGGAIVFNPYHGQEYVLIKSPF